MMFLRKLVGTVASKVLRREYCRGQGVWWGATATHLWCNRVRGGSTEGDVSAEAGRSGCS